MLHHRGTGGGGTPDEGGDATSRPDVTERVAASALLGTPLAVPRSAGKTTIPAPLQKPNPRDDHEVPTERIWRHDTPNSAFILPLARRDRATLTMLSGPNAGATFALHAHETIIGRGEGVTLCVEEGSVSRRHARIVRRGEGYAIEDLASTNGTFVAARRVERAPLAPGDRVQIGATCVFRFAIVDETEESLQRRLYESSTRDSLTGAFNRKCFFEHLEAELTHARQSCSPLSLLMIDVDHFKRVNDAHGHGAGDLVLRSIAQSAATALRAGDLFARYGGEEFATLARAATLREATLLAERLRRAVAALRVEVGAATVGVTISVGVASLDECEPARDGPRAVPDFVGLADARLYMAKLQGRDRVCGSS